jgi:3-deoxy-D-arabino-heptulosonate 7-phosphate (DAHP) synthase class II
VHRWNLDFAARSVGGALPGSAHRIEGRCGSWPPAACQRHRDMRETDTYISASVAAAYEQALARMNSTTATGKSRRISVDRRPHAVDGACRVPARVKNPLNMKIGPAGGRRPPAHLERHNPAKVGRVTLISHWVVTVGARLPPLRAVEPEGRVVWLCVQCTATRSSRPG